MAATGTVVLTTGNIIGNREINNNLSSNGFSMTASSAWPTGSYTITGATLTFYTRHTYAPSSGGTYTTWFSGNQASQTQNLLATWTYGYSENLNNPQRIDIALSTNFNYASLNKLYFCYGSMQLFTGYPITITVTWKQNAGTLTFGSGSVAAGSNLPYTIGNYVGDYRYDIGIKWDNNHTQTFQAVQSENIWIPLERLQYMTTSSSKTFTATLTTKNGSGAVLGTATASFIMTTPASAKPSFASGAVAIEALNGKLGIAWLQGYSRAHVTVDNSKLTPYQGSAITSVYITINNVQYQGTDATSGVINNSGTIPYSVTIYDGRGMSNTWSSTFNVTAYSQPYLTSVRAVRSSQSGVPADDGLYVLCTANYTWSAVSGNSLTVTVRNGNVVLYTGTPDSGVPFVNTNGTLSIDRAYTLTFEISDSLISNSVNFLVQSGNIFLRLSPKTNAIGIGTYPQGGKRVEIDDEWGLYVHGQEVDSRYIKTNAENITLKTDRYKISETPQTASYLPRITFVDSENKNVALIQASHLTDGSTRLSIGGYGGNGDQNNFTLITSSSGVKSVTFADASAWRSGLGVPWGGSGVALWTGNQPSGRTITLNQSIDNYKFLIIQCTGNCLLFRPAWRGSYAAFGARTGGNSSENIYNMVVVLNFTSGTACNIDHINGNWANTTSVSHNDGSVNVTGIYGIK